MGSKRKVSSKASLQEVAKLQDVLLHMDIKAWLHALFVAMKAADEAYTYQQFSNDLGLGSSNAHLVMSGKRPVTTRAAGKIAKILLLDGVQKKYLQLLSKFETSVGPAKDRVFDAMLAIRMAKMASETERDELEFFTDWYHLAIIELLRLPDAKDSAEWICSQLQPRISLLKVKRSLELLCKLGYVSYSAERGRLYPTKVSIRATKDSQRLAVLSLHHQVMDLGKAALSAFGPKEREISSATVTLTDEQFQKFKGKILQLRQELVASADDAVVAGSRVVQFNCQLFPLTRGKT